MTTELITLSGDTPVLPEQSINELNNLIRISQTTVPMVTTIEDKKTATTRGVQLQRWIKDVGEAKKRVKAPVNLLLDNIDALADQLLIPAIQEKERLGKLITQFDRGEQLRIEAANIERDRKVREAQAESDRLAREANERANSMADERQMEIALQAERDAAEASAKERELIVAPMPSSQRVKGTVGGSTLTWEVTDIEALYKARPDFVKLEPNAGALRACLVPGMAPIPGLKFSFEKRTTFRT